MSRLASFLTALWLATAAAQLNVFNTAKKAATNELQAAADPIGKTIAFIGSGACKQVKQIAGVDYEDYQTEPDLSGLTLVFITKAKNVTYNLTEAPTEIPKERWFNTSLPFRIFLHGFTDDPSKSSFQTISSAFLAQGDVNILALDASSLIKYFYLRATTMVRFIGEKLGAVLAALIPAGVKPSNIYLIGHSLGSHIAGFTAKTFLAISGSRVGRISGLDPAGPCFANVDVTLRLTKDDADFVDIIHSDAGVYGLDLQIGHVDFYPNSGSEQPNCLFQTCSHSRAWVYYAESVVKPKAFKGVKCDSWEDFRKKRCEYNDTSIMGFGCKPESRGKYYLQTSDEERYGRGADGLSYVDNAGLVRNVKYSVQDFLG